MNIKNKSLRFLAVIFFLLPEILYSPAAQIYYSFFTNGKILRNNYFQVAGNTFIIIILILQLAGTLYLAKSTGDKIFKWGFGIIFVFIAIALFLVMSLSSIGF